MREHSSEEACELLIRKQYNRILVAGNSLMREMYVSLLVLLLGGQAAIQRDPLIIAPIFSRHPITIKCCEEG